MMRRTVPLALRLALVDGGAAKATAAPASSRLISRAPGFSGIVQRVQHVRWYRPRHRATFYPVAERTSGGRKARDAAVSAAVLAGLGVIFLGYNDTVPISRRRRLMLIPRSLEADLGTAAFESYLSSRTVLPDSHPDVKLVRKIGGALVDAVELASEMRDASDGDRATSQTAEGARSGGADGATSWQWQFVVARDDEVVNAFCMPGGKVVVTTGIIKAFRDNEKEGKYGDCTAADGLAFVMSHEVGHALARHSSESLARVPLLLLLTYLGPLSGVLAQFLLQLPQSRAHESEADLIGLHLMAHLCSFRPKVAPLVLSTLSGGANDSTVLQYFSTHPADPVRAEAAAAQLPAVEAAHAVFCKRQHTRVDERIAGVHRRVMARISRLWGPSA